jgi:hypothetical protein
MLRRDGFNLALYLAIDQTMIEFYLSILTDDEIVRLVRFLKQNAAPDVRSYISSNPRDNCLSSSISSLIFGGPDATLPQQFRQHLADTLHQGTSETPLGGFVPRIARLPDPHFRSLWRRAFLSDLLHEPTFEPRPRSAPTIRH